MQFALKLAFRTQNCRDNPYCLGRLGQQRWDKEKQQIDKEGKATAKCFSRRDVTKVPCGLVNLGNSCYLNSFIQVILGTLKMFLKRYSGCLTFDLLLQ